jgi:hypothetical protein
MVLRNIQKDDLQNLCWRKVGAEGWRIEAELTCEACGAYQAADSDPTTKKESATMLAARLFSSVGWRADDGDRRLCPDCVARAERGSAE